MFNFILQSTDKLENFSTEDFLIINSLYHEKILPKGLKAGIGRLIELGIVERVSKYKYVLSHNLYKAAGKAGVHTRVAGLNRDTNKELLFKHIQDNNETGSNFSELRQVLPSLSDGEIKVLMRELRDENRILCVGKTRNAKWHCQDN